MYDMMLIHVSYVGTSCVTSRHDERLFSPRLAAVLRPRQPRRGSLANRTYDSLNMKSAEGAPEQECILCHYGAENPFSYLQRQVDQSFIKYLVCRVLSFCGPCYIRNLI